MIKKKIQGDERKLEREVERKDGQSRRLKGSSFHTEKKATNCGSQGHDQPQSSAAVVN